MNYLQSGHFQKGGSTFQSPIREKKDPMQCRMFEAKTVGLNLLFLLPAQKNALRKTENAGSSINDFPSCVFPALSLVL